MTDFEFRFAM